MKLPIFLLLIVAAGWLTVRPVVAEAPPRPNILYFYVDDLGWGSIGPNGQHQRKAKGLPSVRTPNLDRLAAEGINFVRGYGCHVCSPARSSQQSGFHQGHTFADRNDPDNAKKAMRGDETLMGDALSAADYVTGYWGKWGYGGSKDQRQPVIKNVQTLPTSHGYQHVLAELHHVRAHTFFQPTLWKAPASEGSVGGLELVANSMRRYQGNADSPNEPALQNHADYPKTAYCDDSYAFAALDFVRRQGVHFNRSGQPFFGLLAVQIPHAPFGEITSLPQWDAAYEDDPHFSNLSDQSRQWAAMVTRIDAHFGNILAALEDPDGNGDTSDSIVDNTLVVFQSDNGGPGGNNLKEFDANGGLRGTKGQIHEGGIRVPMVMRWPATINADSTLKAGTDSHRVVDVTDLLPTFCELAGAPVPLGVDGVSIAPTLTGKGRQRAREFLIHESGNGSSIIRGNWKLVRQAGRRGRPVHLQLFDLANDRSEQHDVASNHPETVAALEELLLGERVTEPKGFAVTYHHWTGGDGDVTSNAAHWSDYHYSNAGITYIRDQGAPRLSWIARIENDHDHPSRVVADKDMEVLALEIRGGDSESSSQSLALQRGVTLTARNELRVSQGGSLHLEEAEILTLRSVAIRPGGTVTGSGSIRGNVDNDGEMKVVSDATSSMQIRGGYQQSSSGKLSASFDTSSRPAFIVGGLAELGGRLTVSVANEFKPFSGQVLTVLTADGIQGRFTNSDQPIMIGEDWLADIGYSDNSVTLTVR